MESTTFEVIEQLEEKPSAALIFLHGTGKSPQNCKSVFLEYLEAPGHPYIKIYLPSAPTRYLTIRDTVTCYWFDVVRTGPKENDYEGNADDANQVTAMIEKKIEEIIREDGIPRERIIVGGTSQGGMVSMYSVYMRGLKCGGVVSIAAYLPFSKDKLLPSATIPMVSIYGEKDAFITADSIAKTWTNFRSKKIPFTVKSLPRVGHYMDCEYAKAMFDWLEKTFPRL